MMKFGIITLVSDNYGNKYQNYAVEQLFSKYGEVETFQLQELYSTPQLSNTSFMKKLSPAYIREVLISRPMYQYDINCVDKGVLYNYFYAKKHGGELLERRKCRSEAFDAFSKKNLHISKKILNDSNVDNGWTDQFDAFICGSDQIWNPMYATTSSLAFCTFAPEKTICLSPSFGVSKIPEYRREEYAEWLKQIKSLSVRESAGQKIIKNLTGRDAEVLVDPTMVLPVMEWDKLSRKPAAELPERYILCYFLGRIDKNYRKRIDDFAKKTGLPIVMLFDIFAPEYYVMDPAEVLYAIKNATYVLTDSFHGTVFSILFHRDFQVFERNEGGDKMNSRLETLLSKFALCDRANSVIQAMEISPDRWGEADKILDRERRHVHQYLEDALKKLKHN